MAGPDLDQAFEIPALSLDPPLEAKESALSEVTAADASELSPRVARVLKSRGGLTLHFPAGRGGLGGASAGLVSRGRLDCVLLNAWRFAQPLGCALRRG